MKLLGWMHRKFRQNGSEALKDFAIGHACNCLTGQSSFDDQLFPKQNYGARQFRQAQKDHFPKSFGGLGVEEEDDDYEEESSAAMSELFHGFLAIGTLGSDPVNTDPSTPTFAISVENITEKETEVTENELKLINDELEKVLVAEECCNESSGRNSYVSLGRSSHCSTITLSGKPMEGQENNGNGTAICPLQGYLFGSAIELSETTTMAKKEHRTSLGELFQKTKIAEESCAGKFDREDKRTEKETDKSAVHLVKKILRKKMLHASKSANAAGGGTADSASAETKLNKILQMFHKKVHPESSISGRKVDKPQKYENKKNNYYNGTSSNEVHQMLPEEDITIIPHKVFPRKSIRRYKSQFNPPQCMLIGSDSNGSRECWIKTDADYLVLEL